MKFSENWLRTFVNPPLSTRELAHALTMSGVEVETIEPAAPPFSGVVVGEVLEVQRHPQGERLTVYRVSTGTAPLDVVCGAPNVKVGTKVPTALPGAQLPGKAIAVARGRGIESNGMLGSGPDLGLAEGAEGLLLLPENAVVGRNVREVLDLDDQLLTLKPTPNRGDCLSVLGVAREVGAVCGASLRALEIRPARVAATEKFP